MSFVFEFEHAFSFIGELFWTNIYSPQAYIIPYNDIICTRKQKLNANNNFFSYSYLTTWLYYGGRDIFTFSSHTEYVKRESIVIAWVKKKKKFSPFDKCLWFLCLRRQNKPKTISVFLSVCLDVWMSGCTYVRGLFMWTQ